MAAEKTTCTLDGSDMDIILDNDKKAPALHAQMLGCMLGGAVGDALGAPVASLHLEAIRGQYGLSGIAQFELVHGRKGAISANTQMALFTAEGLILSRVRQEYAQKGLVITAVYHAYLRWLYTQDTQHQRQLVNDHGTCAVIDGVLTGHRKLFSRRTPGKSCLSALRSGQMGSLDQPINDGKGCGGVIRVAPIGLATQDPEASFRLGCESAAITHGHPAGYLCAGFLAALISLMVSGLPLTEAILSATRILKAHEGHGELSMAVETAIELYRRQRPSPGPEAIESLGAGWVAAEALAIGLYCALVAGNDFRQGVLLSVNHSGNSSSTGSITGNIVGTLYGIDVIPDKWLDDLEVKDLIGEVATDLFDQNQESF